ncbi:MAG: glycosyltransferase family 2 protein [Candidatus Levybacteria bacterium]|nr:glycosyltransferase family 2 protein [Candidatus Levybacteria bacterium]
MQPTVSVIILNWNRYQDVSKLIRKLKKQTFKNFETIVVDNASTDNSVLYLKKYFPDVKIIRMTINLGVFGKNLGFKNALGEYLIAFDSDVVINNDCVEKFVQKLKKNKNLGIACASVYEQKTKRYLGPNRSLNGNNRVGYEVCFFNGSAIAIKKELFKKVGGYSKDYFICLEELEWATRVLESGFDISCFTDIIVYNKKSVQGGNYRSKLGFWYSRNWIWFYIEFLPLNKIPSFLFLHLKSAKNYAGTGTMKKRDYFFGILAAALGVPKFLLRRKPITDRTLQKIKLDLFPNSKHLYTRF